jgi:hypothetical protein
MLSSGQKSTIEVDAKTVQVVNSEKSSPIQDNLSKPLSLPKLLLTLFLSKFTIQLTRLKLSRRRNAEEAIGLPEEHRKAACSRSLDFRFGACRLA